MTKTIGKLGGQLGLLIMLLSGCSATTTIDEYRPTDQPIVLSGDEKVVILGRRDAGHYETEQFTIELLAEYLQNKFRNFAVLKTERQTNPVRFFTG